jgi:HAD superfamily hydrolase (TIGR01549 family)
MSLTLLLDLDDTLLDSNMNAFIPAYFQKLAGYLADRVSPDELVKYLMIGTRQMMSNSDPRQTLRETFDANFYQPLGLDREQMRPVLETFYDEIFPALQVLTRPKPEAVAFVDWAVAQGYRIAIATNPLFPQKAIYHRLRWAGLDPQKYPFEVITSYEEFHFSKPNPAYFAEVLARMGWPDGPVLLVGDDPELDIIPAMKMGLSSFWIMADGANLPDGLNPVGEGQIKDLCSWLEGVDKQILQPDYNLPDGLLAVLRSTPAAIASKLARLSSSQWKRTPQPDEWSVTEIMCHLRDVDLEVNLPRLKKILEQDNPFVPGMETDVWAKERGYSRQNGLEALGDFTTARVELIEQLRNMDEATWNRKIRHAIFGPSTFRELVGFMAEHDRVHVRQIYETLKNIEE